MVRGLRQLGPLGELVEDDDEGGGNHEEIRDGVWADIWATDWVIGTEIQRAEDATDGDGTEGGGAE